MKKHLTHLMLASGLIFFLTHADTITASSAEKTTGTEQVFLMGEFKTGGLRSAGGDAISVEIQGNSIIATFHRDLKDVLITITGTNGTVYEKMVNSSSQTQVFIPLSGLSSGKYTITFSNNTGSMYGGFEI